MLAVVALWPSVRRRWFAWPFCGQRERDHCQMLAKHSTLLSCVKEYPMIILVRRFFIAASAAILAGCAASPESIGPAYVSPMNFRGWTCEQLAEEGQRLYSALQVASEKQRQAQNTDTIGVLLVGLPLGSMTGQGVAPEISRVRGEHEALYRVAVEKGCATDRDAGRPG
jgi:hypothetical protein